MIYLTILMSAVLSVPVALAFRGYGPKAMAIAGITNFVAYMLGLWLLGAFA